MRASGQGAAFRLGLGLLYLCSCQGVNPAYRAEALDARFDGAPETGTDTATDAPAGDASEEAAQRDLPVAAEASPPEVAPPPPDAGSEQGGSADANAPDLVPDVVTPLPTFALGAVTVTARRGVDMGNTIHDDRCPDGQVLIGYRATSGLLRNMGTPVVTSLAAQCGTAGIKASPPTIVSITPASAFPERGVPTGTPIMVVCPTDQVVVTFDGRAGSFLDQLRIGCASLTVAEQASGLTVNIGAVTRLAAVGGNGGTAFQDGCPSGRIAVGHRLESATVVDTFAMACALPSATR